MSDAAIGWGTKVYMGATPTTNDASLTKLIEVTNVQLPNPQTADVEVTHYESPTATREYIAGLKEPGTITVEGNYIPGSATDSLLLGGFESGETRPFRINIPVATQTAKFAFPGIVRGYERSAPVDGRRTFTATIRIAGAITQTVA